MIKIVVETALCYTFRKKFIILKVFEDTVSPIKKSIKAKEYFTIVIVISQHINSFS